MVIKKISMRKWIVLLTPALVIFLIGGCSSIGERLPVQKVMFVYLREQDTSYIKITNHSDSILYFPGEYAPDYTINSDTLHLETINKPEYNTTYYYRYTKIFPFEFYTSRRIEGYLPDSIEKYKQQTYYFNQFRVRPFKALLPDSSCTVKLIFTFPKYANVVKAVFYNKPFLTEAPLNKVEYSLGDFIKFDNLNARYVISPILNRYH